MNPVPWDGDGSRCDISGVESNHREGTDVAVEGRRRWFPEEMDFPPAGRVVPTISGTDLDDGTGRGSRAVVNVLMGPGEVSVAGIVRDRTRQLKEGGDVSGSRHVVGLLVSAIRTRQRKPWLGQDRWDHGRWNGGGRRPQ